MQVLTTDTNGGICYALTMPRELRQGAIYHVLNRGDQRDDIFPDDQDRQEFLRTLQECCGKPAGRCMPIASCPTTFIW